jgi:hypothetical protein
MSQNRKNIEKIKIYLIKKIKMKIQNKYIFKTITSEFLYYFFKQKAHGSNMVVMPKRLSQK